VIDLARKRGLDRSLAVRLGSPEGGEMYNLTAGGALIHVLTHGHYHRAQCMNMLRRLETPGVSDRLPDLDVCEWQNSVDGRRATSSPR
jgi:uncharacterized damage-inducible protein DinB